MIKPEFWDDEKLARVSRESRLLFAGLWTYSDDFGVVKGNLGWLQSKIFPYDRDIKAAKFASWIEGLESNGFIIPFDADGEKYFYIKNFHKHQNVDHPSKQRNPEPPVGVLSRDNRELSRNPRVETESESETETETEVETETETEAKTTSPDSRLPAKAPDAGDVQLTQLLIDLILQNNPESSIIKRLTPKRQADWINQVRLMRVSDGRTPRQIEAIIRFSQADKFWRANILSTPKLREKWDTLVMQARRGDKLDGVRDWLNESPKEKAHDARG